jgi:hypothetical protein
MGAHTSIRSEHDSALIERFVSLSSAEKAEIGATFEILTEENRKELCAISALLRTGEGAIFKRVVNRFKSVAQPVSTGNEGVHVPLDARHDSSSQITIWIPEDLETHADSAIMADLLRYAAHVPGVKLQRTKGTLPDNDQGDWFIMGYVTELLSDQVIKQIRYTKDSAYSLGRACARSKLVLACLDQHKIPSTYLNIPERFLGGVASFKEPEISRALKTFYTADDAKHIEKWLQVLSTHLIRVSKEGVRSKLGETMFAPAESVINKAKRHVSVTEKTTRGRSKTVQQVVTPTKPSQLATVAQWERSAITELYEKPWLAEKDIVENFKQKSPIDRDYVDFRKKLSVIFERQWAVKQQVLRATAHRLKGYPGEQSEPLYRKLNWCREWLRSVNTMASIPVPAVPDFDPTTLIPSFTQETSDGRTVTVLSYIRCTEGKDLYPATSRLIEEWESLQAAFAGANASV